MPKISQIPSLIGSFTRLYELKLISPGCYLTNKHRLEMLERKERKRLLTIAKQTNDLALAHNEISLDTFMANWRAICEAREVLDGERPGIVTREVLDAK